MIVRWLKSSHSEAHGNCVELAALPGVVGLRDSTAPEAGHLTLTPAEFAALLTQVKRGESSR